MAGEPSNPADGGGWGLRQTWRVMGDTDLTLDPLDASNLRVFGRRLQPARPADVARRATQIATAIVKHFSPVMLRHARTARADGVVDHVRNLTPDEFATPLRKTFEELGTTFMKFGQLVASSPGMFGDEIAAEFRSCLDTGAPVPIGEVREVIEAELGMSLEDAFTDFEPEPIGCASIAVVHRATLADGTTVAVKVLRPGIERRIATDLDVFEPMLELVARITGEYAVSQMVQLFGGFRLQLGEELDLRNEARAIEHMAALLEVVDLPLVTVPAVHADRSGARVLTMDFLEGVPVDDLAAIEAYGFDPAPVVRQVVQGFLMTAIRWGFFHGDVHAGNLLLLPDGHVGVIDWGIIGRLDPQTHRFFRAMVEAALGDDDAWGEIAHHVSHTYGEVMASMGMSEAELVTFIRATLEPLLKAPFGQVKLSEIINAPQKKMQELTDIEPQKLSVPAILKRFREQRKVRKLAAQTGVIASDFERGLFLLTKALMYFERYGKMYLADVSIFHDEEFFRTALAESRPLPLANSA
jgi:predicted unusual protein kinase regulating ubiquinone biosynthesis (AarF/ABC1/UbiB family)